MPSLSKIKKEQISSILKNLGYSEASTIHKFLAKDLEKLTRASLTELSYKTKRRK